MTDRRKIVNSATRLAEMHRLLDKLFAEHRYLEFEWRVQERQRTLTQSNALHLWLQWLAEELNDAGLDMRRVLKPEFEMSWTKESAKEYLFRPVYHVMTQKQSTADANRVQYSQVAEEIGRHLQQNFGVTPPPWPKKKDKEDV